MGLGVGLPEGLGFGVHLWIGVRNLLGSFSSIGRALYLPLGVDHVWGSLYLTALTSWRSLQMEALTPWSSRFSFLSLPPGYRRGSWGLLLLVLRRL